ncbi:hypothetical protein B0H13DRAFT_1889141 [Mycena leptocephala]|nr:hypothetical protein B0H13DRAFT_1889141 [Mycena leptocephala]
MEREPNAVPHTKHFPGCSINVVRAGYSPGLSQHPVLSAKTRVQREREAAAKATGTSTNRPPRPAPHPVGAVGPGQLSVGQQACRQNECNDYGFLIPLHKTVYPEVDLIASTSDNDNNKPLEPEVRIPKSIQNKGTFDIDIGQYTRLSKGDPLTVLPASCLIIDSPPHWPSNKPVPYPGKFDSASGHVVAMENKQVNGSPYENRFKIMADNVVHLGEQQRPFDAR